MYAVGLGLNTRSSHTKDYDNMVLDIFLLGVQHFGGRVCKSSRQWDQMASPQSVAFTMLAWVAM